MHPQILVRTLIMRKTNSSRTNAIEKAACMISRRGFSPDASSREMAPDPKLANTAFVSPDEFLSTPQEFNLYAYVWNNPLKYHDSAGLNPQESKESPESKDPPESKTPESKKLKPDTPVNEILYGSSQLLLKTDMVFYEGGEFVVRPMNWDMPDAVKVAYGILLPPIVVGSIVVHTAIHVGKNVGHIVKGSVRLALGCHRVYLFPGHTTCFE